MCVARKDDASNDVANARRIGLPWTELVLLRRGRRLSGILGGLLVHECTMDD